MGGYLSSSNNNPVLANDSKDSSSNKNIVRDTVIIPIDPSKQAETAFEWYMKHVHRPENFVYIVHCQELEHPSGENYPDYMITPESFTDHYEAAAKKAKSTGLSLLDKYRAKLQEKGVRGEVKSDVGRPGDVVVSAADRYNASMIVMGTRGYGVIRRSILGSVSEYVIHHSKVPVTVVPRETQHWFF